MDYLLPLAQFTARVARHPDQPYLHQPRQRQWQQWSWADVDREARTIAMGLSQHFKPGDRIAILGKNSAEWFIADLAIMMAGMISVPIYATAGGETIFYVLEHSEAKAVFVGKLDDLVPAQEGIPAELMRIAFPYQTVAAQQHWADWLQQYQPLAQLPQQQQDDMLTLVYTSGSTGKPKGVALNCRNVASSSFATANLMDWREGDRCLSYLPLAHITERCVLEMMSIYSGVEVFFTESLATFIDDVKHAKPSFFVSVPRLWTKFQAGILDKMPDEKLQRLLRIPLLGRFVSYKIRKGLGLHKCRMFGSGSAPISPAILHWYHRCGIDIAEGWGMTETSGLSCSNFPFTTDRIGTIGVPVSCVEMRLGDSNEVQIRGEAIFNTYYRDPQKTAEAFVDGWFKTGDMGAITADGAYQIVGRLKEQFKTAKGKYVAPAPLENLLARSNLIDQVCVVGSGLPQPIALVVLNELAVKMDAANVESSLAGTLRDVNEALESHQRIGALLIAGEVWTTENDLLTPTLKIRRAKIESHYSTLFSQQLPAQIVWQHQLG